MSYNDDQKMKLLKEAWKKMEEGDITYGATPEDKATDAATKPHAASGTAKNVRTPVAKPPAGVKHNLAEEEDDTGVPASAEAIGAGDAGAGVGLAEDLYLLRYRHV